MMKFNDFQKYQAILHIPYEKYFELIYETKYLLEARLSSHRMFIARKSFYGCNRRSAVAKACEWYNKNVRQVLGPPQATLTIDDPLAEVVYDVDFVCTDLRNKYLDNPTIERLIKDADGDLEWEKTSDSSGLVTASVKRVKRRRKKETQVTDRLVQSSGGTIYYKMLDLPDGKSTRMKMRKIKLASKSLVKAKKEVIRRGLNRFEKFSSTKEPSANPLSSSIKAA